MPDAPRSASLQCPGNWPAILSLALLASHAGAQGVDRTPAGNPSVPLVPGTTLLNGRSGQVLVGGPNGQERQLVGQFDKDGDKRLNLEERQAAFAFLGSGTNARGGGRGRFPEAVKPGIKLTPADVKQTSDAPIYDIATLRTYFLEFEESNWETMMAAFNNTDIEMPAKVTVDGKTYPGVGVHFRGNSSFFSIPSGYKRSLSLTFDFVDEKQNLGGYRTFNLLNSNGDPTMMRAVLYTEVARNYIPTPKANFVRVVINGENWGIYQNIQQFNKDMVQDLFGTTKGARWKVPGNPGGQGSFAYVGDKIDDYKRTYTIKTKDDPKDWEALIQVFKVLNQTPPDQLEAALSPLLDIDGALKFLALDNTLLSEDGYWTRASDYNIYRDTDGRFHVLPHDVNETFFHMPGGGRGGPGGPENVSLSPLVNENVGNRALASKLFAVPALKTRYLGYVREIAAQWLDWNRLGTMVQDHWMLIAMEAARDTRKLDTTENFSKGTDNQPSEGVNSVISLRNFADKRRAFVLKFLDDLPKK